MLLLCTLVLTLWMANTQAAPSLVLDAHTQTLDLWPDVQVLDDPEGSLDLPTVLARSPQFAAPHSARGSLGLHHNPVWLRVSFDVAPTAIRGWMLDSGSTTLHHLDMYLLRDHQVVQHAALGTLQARAPTEPPRAARTQAVALQLAPGQPHELLLRIQSDATMMLPLTLSTPDAFLARALRDQLLQGALLTLMTGVVLYSAVLWLTLRDPLFPKYIGVVLGGLGFALGQQGIGAQYLWSDSPWMLVHAAPLAAMCSAMGFALFFEHALVAPAGRPWLSQLMKASALACVLLALAFATNTLSTQQIGPPLSVLSLTPPLASLPLALQRTRQKDPMGTYLLLAVLVYLGATATMAGVVYGHVPVNGWTRHSVQLSSLLDALLLGRMLVLRTQTAQRQAQLAGAERDAMRSLAHTDALTGVLNRRGLDDALARALAHCTPEHLLVVYVIDLDGFKQVNDRHGHDVGDELLVAVVGRLRSLVRNNDVVARIGGDEFVILVEGMAKSTQAVEMGHKLLAAFHTPFQLARHTCQVGLTIGYALAPLDGLNATRLLKNADAGMYQGKTDGKHCLRRYQPPHVKQTS
jgi:diguanylate cyclase (GGDEF)-like protein